MNRVYIDTTDTANTLHHTGIQRVVRNLVLFGAVRGEEWMPVVWDGSGYRAPTKSEQRRLLAVFSKGIHRRKLLSRWLERWEKKWPVDFLQEREGTMLLIPEIPSGARLEFLDDLAATGRRQIQMVAVCHDLFSWSHPEWTAESRREGFVDYLRFLGLVERVICPSEFTASEWQRFQDENNVVGAPGEVMPWPVTGEPKERIQKLDTPMILCVATLEARKNHGCLLDAAVKLWDEGVAFRLVLVGRKRAKGENGIPDRVKALEAKGHSIEWRGAVTEEELEELYQESLFTVFPSLAEGFGLPVGESLVRGKPCVCSSEGAMGEIAEGGGCLTVDVSDAGSLAGGIRSLLADTEMQRQLAEQAKGRIWGEWSEWMDQLVGPSGDEVDEESDSWTLLDGPEEFPPEFR